MVWIEREIVYLECPFCHKNGVEAMYHPASLSAHVTRSAVAKATRFFKVKERYEVLNDCKFCGKSKAEINKSFKEGITIDSKKLKKRFDELQKLKEEMKKERENKPIEG